MCSPPPASLVSPQSRSANASHVGAVTLEQSAQRPTQARKNRDPMNDATRQQIIELLTTPPTNGDTHTMEFISDSSHGWLKVPVSAYQLADAPASRFSYADSDNVYLEEDSDAPRFLKAVGIVNRDSGLELDGERWYIPERNLVNQRRYNEVSPRDMRPLLDANYSDSLVYSNIS